ncbi:hypothetical protein ACUNV4_28975 [Granulosicoccus sp. 3-233]|uniref:hypothetical protein n=1 Tax=Granulosicoccus sp. 3-233 TaxID=3417969 RepID=UPI003D340246
MNFARAMSSYAILVFFSLFVYLNTINIEGSHGFVFLFAGMAVYGILIVISGNLSNFLMWRIPAIFLATFFIYFATKLYVESGTTWEVRRHMLSTTSGVLLTFIMGLMVSQALSAIYDLRKDTQSSAVLYLMTTLYGILVLVFALLVFFANRENVSSDVFRTEELVGYQRVGDYFSLQFLALAALVCVIAVTSKRDGARLLLIPSLILMAACGIFAFTSQLLGSNKGFVVPIGILFIYFAVIFAAPASGTRVRRTSILNILLSGMVFKLLFASLIGLVLVVVLGGTVLQILGIDADALRITGFGTGEVTSVTGRSELFSRNFMLHFAHSPIFGNTQVHLLTTGEGTYVHSTLSVLTHLGVVGFVIFLCILVSIYLEISHSFIARHSSIYGNQTYGLFRLLCIFAVLTMGMFSAFFTWSPLWFSLGLFGNWYHQSRVNSQLFNKGTRSTKRRRHRRSRLAPAHK